MPLLPPTFTATPEGARVAPILAAALQAVDPEVAVARFLRRESDTLFIDHRPYPLARTPQVLLLGAGKAGVPMARAAAAALGDALAGGLILVKEGHGEGAASLERVAVTEAGHPVPDARGEQAAREMIDLLGPTGVNHLILCLISGGGSALLNAPVPGVSLAGMQTLTGQLLASGAAIHELNTLRKHLDQLKGGQLARLAAPSPVAALILSDVVGNFLDVIASGPTVPDPTTYPDAWQVLVRYGLEAAAPEAILRHLQRGLRGEVPETPKPGDPLFRRVQNVLVGSNLQAAEAAQQAARKAGFRAQILTSELTGEASEKGRWLGRLARMLALTGHPLGRPACLIAGGETTVTLHGAGRGGRNQELALAAVSELAGLPDVALLTLATDGGDGPTDAAGALVTGETLARARALGLDPADFLARNDAYTFFDALGDLLRPGPTQTNVNDLAFIFAF